MTYVAHQRDSDKTIQTVKEHVENVSLIARCLAEKIGVPDIGELLGLLHDFGKYSSAFQAYIQSARCMLDHDRDDDFVDAQALKGQIDHSTAGAQWIWKHFGQYGQQGSIVGQILALCLASHHSGLIDCLDPTGYNRFLRRMNKKYEQTHLEECVENADDEVLDRLEKLATPTTIQQCSQQIRQLFDPARKYSSLVQAFHLGLWTRFLFSCLIDADRIDSADFENPKNKTMRQLTKPNWQTAIDRLEEKLAGLPVKTEIDPIRRDVSNRCKEKASEAQGIYTLTVPTGGGKTYSSIRFALYHAQKHGLDRIIYIIPYTSIIEQNAQAIREVLERKGDVYSWVLEHHSNLEPERLTWRDKLVAENWDAPIIFTTMVQFLDVLFSGGTRGARRMHQLARSVLIFDEIQTLPIKCVHLFCNAINFLVENAKTTAVLCTATQPLLDNLRSPDKGQLSIPSENELAGDVSTLFRKLKRVEIKNRVRLNDGWSESELADFAIDQYLGKGSCLVVVNTKAWAQQLYLACKERIGDDSLYHLSTSLCPAHRKKILKTIRDRLDAGKPVLCISTQLIEAGVDVDFASVVRFLAGLDSIAQAAGRCNRHKKRPLGHVYVVNPREEKIDLLVDIREGRDKALRVLGEKDNSDLLAPDVMARYFSYYFYDRAKEMDYPLTASQVGRDDSLLNLLGDNSKNVGKNTPLLLKQSFATAGRIFNAIDAPTKAVIVPFEEGKEIIAKLCAVPEPAKAYKLMKQAQQFSVNVFPNVWKQLLEHDAVVPIQPGEEIYYLREQHYSHEFGLSVEGHGEMEFLEG